MKYSKLAPMALAAVVGFAGKANAEEIALRSTRPAAESVEWTGPANSSNLVSSTVDKTRRELTVVATTNAPVVLHGACPAPSSYPGWKLATEAAKPGMDSGKLVPTSTIRTGENGTFDIHTTMPSRPGQTVEVQLACVGTEKREVVEKKETRAAGVDGVMNTPDDIVTSEDVKVMKDVETGKEVLKATLTSVATTPDGSAIMLMPAGSFPYRDRDADGRERKPVENPANAGTSVMVQLGLATTSGLSDKPGVGGGLIAGVEAKVHGLPPLGLVYRRAGSLPQNVTADDGTTTKVVEGTSHCGFAGAGWHPNLGENLRAITGVGVGACYAEQIHTSPVDKVAAQTSAAARLTVGAALHGKNLGVGLTGDVVVGTAESSRFGGVGLVVSAEF